MILTLRTDKPESEIGLYDGQKKIAYETWQAHRQLAETIHKKLDEVLDSKKPNGIVVYKGPGSFTGLRIGTSVANALAYSLDIPIAGANGENWISDGISKLETDPSKRPATPEYGQPAGVTQPKK
jgi:tRNA threonylcarbamoyladenosine biosynthesis protein TsaB